MAAGDFLTWAVQAQDAPAHVARILQTILLNEGVVDVAGDSFTVAQDTGSNMNIKIGSGTLGDLAAVEGDDAAGQGVYVIEAQNATVTKTIAASDATNDRIDLVVLQNYDDEADSSGSHDAEVEVVEGTPAGSPSAPALPDSAIPLAEVLVGAGVTAITNANITDARAAARLTRESRDDGPRGVLPDGYAEVTANQGSITGFAVLTGLSVTVDVAANRRIRVSAQIQASVDVVSDTTIQLALVGGGSSLQRSRYRPVGNNRSGTMVSSIVHTPAAGSVTYQLQLRREVGTGTVSMVADADNKAFILVEDIGPA